VCSGGDEQEQGRDCEELRGGRFHSVPL
jgi:hypothetical protein